MSVEVMGQLSKRTLQKIRFNVWWSSRITSSILCVMMPVTKGAIKLLLLYHFKGSRTMGFSLNGAELSLNSVNSENLKEF